MQIIEITDLNCPEIEVYSALSERQLATIYEPGEGLFIAESPKVIERALQAGYEAISFLAEKEKVLTTQEEHYFANSLESSWSVSLVFSYSKTSEAS